MKKIICLVLLLVLFYSPVVFAQQGDSISRDFIATKRNVESSWKVLMDRVYQYRSFVDASLVFREGAVTTSKMNYHRYLDQLRFIRGQDTMIVSDPGLFKYFVLDKDTFYFTGNGYAYQVTHYEGVNLAKKEVISFVGAEKQGAYGTYSAVTSVNTNTSYSHDDIQQQFRVNPDERIIYKMENRFYLKDRFNNFFPVTKKHIYDLFSSKEKEIKQYIKSKKADLEKEEDLVELMKFIYEQ